MASRGSCRQAGGAVNGGCQENLWTGSCAWAGDGRTRSGRAGEGRSSGESTGHLARSLLMGVYPALFRPEGVLRRKIPTRLP